MMDRKRSHLMNQKDDVLAQEIIRETLGGKDPDLALAEEFLDEIEARLDHIKVYYPILDLLRKRKLDSHIGSLAPEVCFLVLSYLIYEGKLRYKGVTFQNLQSFLAKALQAVLLRDLEPDTIRELTAEILDSLQNGGRNFTISTYHFPTGKFREKYIKLLEIKQAEDQHLYYYITEQGVDFFLRTKEFPDETKITINLLLFQKQMEKGAFGFAYETVRRLNMEVQKKKDKKYALLEAMMYGQIESSEAYDRYHQSIAMQMEEEAELFQTAVKNVRSAYGEYVDMRNKGEADTKQMRTFTLIKIIEREIGRAQLLHTELLKEAVTFTGEYDKALTVRRKAVFTDRFPFQREFEKLITHNGKPEAMKFFFEPLLHPHKHKSFNPLRAVEPQRVAKNKMEEATEQTSSNRIERPTVDTIIGNRVKGNFVFYAANLLKALDNPQRQVQLTDLCQMLIDRYSKDLVYNGDFISFLIELNRDKKVGNHSRTISWGDAAISVDEELKSIEAVFVKAASQLQHTIRMNQITVISYPETEIELLPGLKITNMLFAGDRP